MPDELRFVGSIEPNGVVLPHVVGVTALADIARSAADLVVLDTTSVVAGVVGQTLKYHIAELTAPSLVVAIGRGAELEPVVGMLRRFLSLRVAEAEPPDDLVPLEVPKGTMVVLNGLLPHWSAANRSSVSRHAYTVHCISAAAEYPAAASWE